MKSKPLIYIRPAPGGVELCIQDGDSFKVYPLNPRKMLQMIKDLVKAYESGE